MKEPDGAGDRCVVEGCRCPTSREKPYCLEHAISLAFPMQVREGLLIMEEQDEVAEAVGNERACWREVPPPPRCLRAVDVLLAVAISGARTITQVGEDAGMNGPLLWGHLWALEHRGYLRLPSRPRQRIRLLRPGVIIVAQWLGG